jgi:hypothetical protein
MESTFGKPVQRHRALGGSVAVHGGGGGSVAVHCGGTGSVPGHCVWIYREWCRIRRVFRQESGFLLPINIWPTLYSQMPCSTMFETWLTNHNSCYKLNPHIHPHSTGWSKSVCAPDSVYPNNPDTIDDSKMAITEYIRNVQSAILNTIFENTCRRINKCLEIGGGNFEHYV